MKTGSRDGGGGVVAPSDRKTSKDPSLGEQTSYTIFSLRRLSLYCR